MVGKSGREQTVSIGDGCDTVSIIFIFTENKDIFFYCRNVRDLFWNFRKVKDGLRNFFLFSKNYFIL